MTFQIPLGSPTVRMRLPVKLRDRMFLNVPASWSFSIEGGNEVRLRAGYDALPNPYVAAIVEQSPEVGFDEKFAVAQLQLSGAGVDGTVEVEFDVDTPAGADIQLGFDDPKNPYTSRFILDAAKPQSLMASAKVSKRSACSSTSSAPAAIA